MVKYFFKRLLRGCLSVVVAISIIMVMLFVWMDNTQIFAEDEQYHKLSNNQKTSYMYTMWEKYGYLDLSAITIISTSWLPAGR